MAFQLKLKDFEEAACRICNDVIQTPLLLFEVSDRKLMFKAECSQELDYPEMPAGANAMEMANEQGLRKGVVTASARNVGKYVAKPVQNRGLPVHVIVPDAAAKVKA